MWSYRTLVISSGLNEKTICKRRPLLTFSSYCYVTKYSLEKNDVKLWAIICGNSHLITLHLISGICFGTSFANTHFFRVMDKGQVLKWHLVKGTGGWEMAFGHTEFKKSFDSFTDGFYCTARYLLKKNPTELSVMVS